MSQLRSPQTGCGGAAHRWWPLAALPALFLATTPTAHGADPPGWIEDRGDRPATWDMSVEQLQSIGLGQYRGDLVPVPPEYLGNAPTEPLGVKQGVVFVNYDGAQLSSGRDDSITNTTQLGNLAGNFAAYGTGSKRDATTQAVIQDWSPFNVIVTDTRPGSGDYTMNMTGPTNPYGGGVLGVAPVDCDDQQTHNNITFAFHSANDNFSSATQATTIGQEVAHSYGLEHVNEPGDIMNPYNAGGEPEFTDVCIAIVGSSYCPSQHQAECGSSSQQNSYQELMTLFGPSTPDTAPPEVMITYPNEGDMFEAGANFTITATASDDQSVNELRLFIDGAFVQADGSEPYDWGVTDIPEGQYELHVIANDLAGNETMSNVVNIGVGMAPGGGSSGGSDGAGSDSSGDTDGAGSSSGSDDPFSGTDSDGLPPGFGDTGKDEGCACTFAQVPVPAGLLWLALGLGRRRRRN